jgi:hypothetical protein
VERGAQGSHGSELGVVILESNKHLGRHWAAATGVEVASRFGIDGLSNGYDSDGQQICHGNLGIRVYSSEHHHQDANSTTSQQTANPLKVARRRAAGAQGFLIPHILVGSSRC